MFYNGKFRPDRLVLRGACYGYTGKDYILGGYRSGQTVLMVNQVA